MTDPIADMLTRVRNAINARHPKVDVPASKLKTEIARILREEGFILNYKLTEEGAKKYIRIYLKYTPGNVPVISRIERVSRPGLPRVCGQQRSSARVGRSGSQHPDHPARRDDRLHRPQRGRGWRGALPGLVAGVASGRASGNER